MPAETYSGSVSEATTSSDIDADGNTTDTFASSTASATLAGLPALLPVKEICQPDDTRPDGCNWLSDPAVTLGVPPSATSIRYRVTIRNTGQTNLSNVVVYDVLPYPGDFGTSDISASTPRGSTVKEQLSSLTADSPSGMTIEYSTSTNPPRPEVFSGATSGTWGPTMSGASAIKATIPTLTAGTSRTFTYAAALVGASADQTACNSVAVSAATLVDSEPPRVCASTQEADFSIDPTSRLPLQAKRVGVVPFVVNNGGGSQSASATVTITVPAEVEVVDLAPEGWDCTAPSMTGPVEVTCTPVNDDGTTRSLEKDAPESIELQVRPTEDAPVELCFDALVEGLMHDPDLENNTAQSCSTALSAKPELLVSKDDGQTSAAVGEEFTYTITASSRLVAEAIHDVTLTDTLPDGLEFVSANPTPTSQVGQALTWDMGQLEQAAIAGDGGDLTSGGEGSSKSVAVTVRVMPGTQDSITNLAEATGTDPADSSITLSAGDDDVDSVTNVFIDEGAEVFTPQNTPVETPLVEIASSTGAPLDPSLVTQATAPEHGSLTIDASTGAVTFVPAAGYSGNDSYQVQVCDTTSPTPQCFIATVILTVEANVVDAVDDTDTTDAITAVTTDVADNDTSQSGQPLSNPTVTDDPSHGTTAVNDDGRIRYTPVIGFSGTDSYIYRICDTSHPTPVCDTARVTIEVANDWGYSGLTVETPHNTPVTTPLADLVTTTGAPLDPGTVVQVTAPTHGSLVIDASDGAVTYIPDPGYAGPDTYTITVCDTSTPTPECNDVTVPVTVLANTVAAPDLTVQTRVGQSTDPIDLIGQTVSTSGQPLDAPTITVEPEHGSVLVNADGTVTYMPAPGYDGPDSFEYQMCDTSHPTPVCDTGTVSVTVTPVADLAVTKTVTTEQVVAGLPISYHLTLANQGPSTAVEVHSIDPVPAAILDPVGTPDAAPDGGTCLTRPTEAADLELLSPVQGPYSLDSHPNVVECTYPSVPAGTTAHVTIAGTVDGDLTDGGVVVNQAVASAATYDPDLNNNRSVATARSAAMADLVLTVTTGERTVGKGDQVKVTFTVENQGPSDATGVVVDTTTTGLQQLDARASARSLARASAGSLSRAADVWSIGDVPSGENVVRTVTYRISGERTARAVGRVSSATPTDPDLDNNGGDACTTEAEGCGVVEFRVTAAPSSDDDDGGPVVLPDTGNLLGKGTLNLALALVIAGAGALVLSRRRRSES